MPWIERNFENFIDPHVVIVPSEFDRKQMDNQRTTILVIFLTSTCIFGSILILALCVYVLVKIYKKKNPSINNNDRHDNPSLMNPYDSITYLILILALSVYVLIKIYKKKKPSINNNGRHNNPSSLNTYDSITYYSTQDDQPGVLNQGILNPGLLNPRLVNSGHPNSTLFTLDYSTP